MSGILRLESLTKGNTLKQGDKTPLKYRLFDADGEKLNIAGKSAVARLMYPDFLRVGYESETLTVSPDNTVTFSIDKIIQPVLYYLEITVDGKYIFPSRNDESKLNIDKSSQGSDVAIIEIIGKDVLVRDIKNMVDSEIEPVVNDMIVSNQKVIENEKIVKDVQILSEQLEARQNQVEQFNNQVITEMTDKDVISAPEIIFARGGEDTLGERLDKEHNEVTAQLAEIVTLTPQEFGILGNGTDETSKVATLTAAIPTNGAKIIFDKTKEIVINSASSIRIDNKRNVVFEGLNLKGTSSAVFTIMGGSKNITFRDCVFKDFGQVIYLLECDGVTIDNCTFENTGYGVIQRYGYVSNNVKIINCIVIDARADFIEANCTATARSKNWIISNNIFKGSVDYELAREAEGIGDFTTYRECRFAGITAIDNLIINGNIIEKVAGDSAVHLEDIGSSYQITNNIFNNILGRGYIFILPTLQTADDSECIIADNTFLRTDSEAVIGVVLNASSGRYVNEILFTNNRIVGLPTKRNLYLTIDSHDNAIITNNTFRFCTTAISAISNNYAIINGNRFRDCDKALYAPSLKHSEICNNNIRNCGYGFDLHDGVSTSHGGAEDCKIIGNDFSNINNYNFISRRNAAGNLPPKRLTLMNNIFSQNPSGHSVRVSGNSDTGPAAAQSITFINNTMKTGATALINLCEKFISGNNVYHDKIGYQPMLPKSAITTTPEFIGEYAIVSGIAYIATGTASTADWKQISN